VSQQIPGVDSMWKACAWSTSACFTPVATMPSVNTRVPLKVTATRVLMVLVSVLVFSDKWASGAQLLLSACLTYLMWSWQPHLVAWVNHVRAGMYSSLVLCSLLYVVSAFNLGRCRAGRCTCLRGSPAMHGAVSAMAGSQLCVLHLLTCRLGRC
jgi:hypothetical protein